LPSWAVQISRAEGNRGSTAPSGRNLVAERVDPLGVRRIVQMGRIVGDDRNIGHALEASPNARWDHHEGVVVRAEKRFISAPWADESERSSYRTSLESGRELLVTVGSATAQSRDPDRCPVH